MRVIVVVVGDYFEVDLKVKVNSFLLKAKLIFLPFLFISHPKFSLGWDHTWLSFAKKMPNANDVSFKRNRGVLPPASLYKKELCKKKLPNANDLSFKRK